MTISFLLRLFLQTKTNITNFIQFIFIFIFIFYFFISFILCQLQLLTNPNQDNELVELGIQYITNILYFFQFSHACFKVICVEEKK